MMPTSQNLLAIDAGQTGIRVMHRALTSQSPSEPLPPTIRDFAGIRTDRELLPQLVDVAAKFCAQTSLRVDTVTAGVSGLTALESRANDLLAGVKTLGATAVFLAHDSVTGFWGASARSRAPWSPQVRGS